MKISKRLPVIMAAAALLAGVSVQARAQSQNDAAAIAIGEKDIGGVVSGPQGREAGVWVIAETTELPTQLRRIVVTDDQGRYLVPDLPQADYSVWVRSYGLVDLYGAFSVKGLFPGGWAVDPLMVLCVLLTVLCSERESRSSSRRLRSGSRSARKESRDRNASGAWRLAAVASLVFRSALTPEHAEGG